MPFGEQDVSLTARRDVIWLYIAEYIDRNGYAPTIREIAKRCGTSSTSAINYQLERMDRDGIIQRTPRIARGIVLLEQPE